MVSRVPVASDPMRSLYFFWARNALYHGLRSLTIQPGDEVLVPAFHCTTVVEPVIQSGAKVVYYNVQRDCSLDLAELQSKINDKTKALLTIHFFGKPQPMKNLRRLCRDSGLYLIEDCAHILVSGYPREGLGTHGDFSIFSLRKFFPIYDGGQLIINNPELPAHISWERESLLLTAKVLKNEVEKLLSDSLGSPTPPGSFSEGSGRLCPQIVALEWRYPVTGLSH